MQSTIFYKKKSKNTINHITDSPITRYKIRTELSKNVVKNVTEMTSDFSKRLVGSMMNMVVSEGKK